MGVGVECVVPYPYSHIAIVWTTFSVNILPTRHAESFDVIVKFPLLFTKTEEVINSK